MSEYNKWVNALRPMIEHMEPIISRMCWGEEGGPVSCKLVSVNEYYPPEGTKFITTGVVRFEGANYNVHIAHCGWEKNGNNFFNICNVVAYAVRIRTYN